MSYPKPDIRSAGKQPPLSTDSEPSQDVSPLPLFLLSLCSTRGISLRRGEACGEPSSGAVSYPRPISQKIIQVRHVILHVRRCPSAPFTIPRPVNPETWRKTKWKRRDPAARHQPREVLLARFSSVSSNQKREDKEERLILILTSSLRVCRLKSIIIEDRSFEKLDIQLLFIRYHLSFRVTIKRKFRSANFPP